MSYSSGEISYDKNLYIENYYEKIAKIFYSDRLITHRINEISAQRDVEQGRMSWKEYEDLRNFRSQFDAELAKLLSINVSFAADIRKKSTKIIRIIAEIVRNYELIEAIGGDFIVTADYLRDENLAEVNKIIGERFGVVLVRKN